MKINKNKKPVPGLYVAGSSVNVVSIDGMSWLSRTGFTSCIVWDFIDGTNAAIGL